MHVGSLGEKTYTVGSAAFPVMDITESNLRLLFGRCGLEVIVWETCQKVTTHYFTIIRRKLN